VVPFIGTNGFETSENVHLSAVVNNVIVYVHTPVYVCVISDETVCFALPSHQSTVYELEKYLLIFIVLLVAVAVASRIILLFILQSAFNVVACVNVTVVDADVALAGLSPLTLVHPLKIYHVSHVALIVTSFSYLYVQAPLVVSTPVQLCNSKLNIFLSYQHAYVLF
jgi:hypothetical protein